MKSILPAANGSDIHRYTQFKAYVLLTLLLYCLSPAHAVVTKEDINRWTAQSGSPGTLTSKTTSQARGELVEQDFEFTEDLSELTEIGFTIDGLDLRNFAHQLRLIKPEGWTGQTLIILINAPDGVEGHLKPEDLQRELVKLQLAHPALKKQFAILEYQTPLPERIKYTLPSGEEVEVTLPLGIMQCSWIAYKVHSDEKKLADLLVIRSLRRLIPLLSDIGVKPDEFWVAGYQTWGRAALLARAIPEVKHILTMGYERTALTRGLQSLIGDKGASNRSHAEKLITSFAKNELFSLSTAFSLAACVSSNIDMLEIKESIQALLMFSPHQVLNALNSLLANEELAQKTLAVTQPTHWTSAATETVMLCTKDLKPDILEPEDSEGKIANHRLFTPGANADICAADILEAITSDMLISVRKINPQEKISIDRGTWYTAIKLKHEIETVDLSDFKIRMMAPGAPVPQGLIYLDDSGALWSSGNFYNQDMLYADFLFSVDGLQGRCSSQLKSGKTKHLVQF